MNMMTDVVVQGRRVESAVRGRTKVVKDGGRLSDVEHGDGEMGVLRRVFDAHGQLCASRPWEVIIATLTVILCTTSLSLFVASNKICDWNYHCEHNHNDDDVSTLFSTQTYSVLVIMPPQVRLAGGGIMFSTCPLVRPSVSASVRPSVCYQTCAHDILKMNELILTQIARSCSVGRPARTKRSTLAVRRLNIKVTRH